LLDAYVTAHAHFGRPMTGVQAEQFYCEYVGLGRLVGVRDGDLPSSWTEFQGYFDDVVAHQLVHTDTVDRVLQALGGVGGPRVPLVPDIVWRAARIPAQRALYVCSIGLLPPILRERLSIRWTRRDQAEFRAIGAFTRRLTPVMPRRLRISGPTQLRWRERAIADGPLGANHSTAAAQRRDRADNGAEAA
jgi:uncharacterized protein (DUF2236 family)